MFAPRVFSGSPTRLRTTLFLVAAEILCGMWVTTNTPTWCETASAYLNNAVTQHVAAN